MRHRVRFLRTEHHETNLSKVDDKGVDGRTGLGKYIVALGKECGRKGKMGEQRETESVEYEQEHKWLKGKQPESERLGRWYIG